MRRSPLAISLLLSAGLYGQDPDPAERQAVLERMKRNTGGYGDRLQDFICLKLTVRSADPRGTGKQWKGLDKLEEEITYIKHQEKRRLLRVDGDSRNPEKRIKKGYVLMAGEFSALDHVFGPKSKAEYEWAGVDNSGSRRLCVFQYRVAEENSTLVWQVGGRKSRSAHHGFVHVDCETGAVWRLELESDQSESKPIGVKTDIRYGPAMIGTKEFLLPLTAVDINRYRQTVTKAEVRFEGYRKYEAESSIQFGDEPPKQ